MEGRCCDGLRPQQIRSGARLHRASDNGSAGVAGCIPGSMVALLHADAYEDASAPCRGDRCAAGQPGAVVSPVRAYGSTRTRAPSPGWDPSPQASLGAPTRLAAREAVGLLAAVHVAYAPHARDLRSDVDAPSAVEERHHT